MFASTTAFYLAALMLGNVAPSPETPADAVGQAEPGIAALTVDIWPEFDDPRVLVIYDGLLAEDAQLPRDFKFVVPAGAQVHMAGGIAPDGGHLHAEFDTRLREDGLVEVSYTLRVPHAYMEFYYDPFEDGDERRFTYPVVSSLEIDSLMVRVQEPLRSEGFQLDPAAEEAVRDNRGLDYGVIRLAGLPAGTVTPVTVSYRKTDREPSMARQQTPPSDQGGSAPSSGPSSSFPWGRAWTWVLGIVGAGSISVGVYKLFGSRVAGPKGSSGGGADPGSSPAARFCTECGHPSKPEHRYCGRCGHSLR